VLRSSSACRSYSFTFQMYATSVLKNDKYQITQCHNPEDCSLQVINCLHRLWSCEAGGRSYLQMFLLAIFHGE